MELTLQELTLVCQIMNIKGIAGFELFPMLTQKEAKEVKASLLKKEILVDESITRYGYSILDTLWLYTKARVYYKFEKNTIFANYAETEFVMIQKKEKTYHVELITQDMLCATILMKFKDWKNIQDKEYKKRMISKEKLQRYMEENEDIEAMYYYKTDIEAKSEVSGVMFLDEGYFQNYKVSSEELEMYPRKQVQEGIETLFKREKQWQQ